MIKLEEENTYLNKHNYALATENKRLTGKNKVSHNQLKIINYRMAKNKIN